MNNTKFEEYTKNLNLKQIHSGSIWTEGPCYLKKSNKVVWSDIGEHTRSVGQLFLRAPCPPCHRLHGTFIIKHTWYVFN